MAALKRLGRTRCAIAFAALWACAHAWAQWGWTDASGRKVFSDMPPPPQVPDHMVFARPAGAARQADPAASGAQPPGKPATAAPAAQAPNGVTDKAAAELEAKKKQAEAAQKAQDEARARAEEVQQARARAENCQRAKDALAALDSGAPLRTMNAKGERVFMDEARRADEKRRAQQAIQTQCVR